MTRSDDSVLRRLREDCKRREEELELMRRRNESDEDMDWILADAHVHQRLLFDPRMSVIWAQLSGVMQPWSLEAAEKLIHEVVRAHKDYKDSYFRTPVAREELLGDIAEKASTLERLLDKAKTDISEEDFARVVPYWSWSYFARKPLQYRSAPPTLDAATVRYVRRWLEGSVGHLQYRPSFRDALTELSKVAAERKAIPPILRQPNRDNAPAYYIALRIREYFRATAEGPRDNDAAEIASVVTGVDIDGANLSRLVKAEK